MTSGHKHRHLRVRKNSVLYRTSRARVYHTSDLSKVDRSPYPYAPCYLHGYSATGETHCYYLSVLSILHRWTGLTLKIKKGHSS